MKPYVCDGSDTWKEPDERLKASSGKRKALVSNKTLKEKMKRQKVGFDTSFDNYMRAFFNQKPSQAPTLLDISLLEDGAANLSLPKKIGKCSRMREFVGFKKPESLDRHEVTLLDALMFKFPLINVLP